MDFTGYTQQEEGTDSADVEFSQNGLLHFADQLPDAEAIADKLARRNPDMHIIIAVSEQVLMSKSADPTKMRFSPKGLLPEKY